MDRKTDRLTTVNPPQASEIQHIPMRSAYSADFDARAPGRTCVPRGSQLEEPPAAGQ